MRKSIVSNQDFDLLSLNQAKDNTERDLFNQFDLKDNKVKQLVKSIGELDTVYTPFRVAFLRGREEYYLVGGRHRLEALNRLGVDSEDLEYYVVLEEVDYETEILNLIVLDNGSRSMTNYEKKSLSYQQVEEEYQAEGSFPSANLMELKSDGVFYHKVHSHGLCTKDTTIKIWGRCLTNLNKLDKKLVKSIRTNEDCQRRFAQMFESELIESLKGYNGVKTISRGYTLVADKISETLYQGGDLEGFAPKERKRGTVIDTETYDWIHSDKLAETMSKSTDIDALRERAEQKDTNNEQPEENNDEGCDIPF